MHAVTPVAFRLTRGADLKLSIFNAVKHHKLPAGCVASVVGCLSHLVIRTADGKSTLNIHDDVEIVSVSGTLTPDHVHLHIAVANKQGDMIGGHLMEGSIVSHTAEVCLLSFPQMAFTREFDEETGYTELVVSEK
ncbi:PPC domain-containing DNA-binding protein [Enterovibrio sp. 27052020O]|uniref:PPC domain-containing DNA-binding protein n=1 Tax=Enterovibrio sp. 27052020O TaxID=3241166 RepID=UPI0038905506